MNISSTSILTSIRQSATHWLRTWGGVGWILKFMHGISKITPLLRNLISLRP